MSEPDHGTDRELLEQAAYTLREFSLRALSVKSFLDVPYRDMPSLTPWTRTIEPEARRAHDLAMTIRKHLKSDAPVLQPSARADFPAAESPDSRQDDNGSGTTEATTEGQRQS